MNPSRLLTLVLLAIVTIGIGTWLANRQATTPAATASEALYPGLKNELNAVAAVRIFKAGDVRVVELVKGPNHWTVTDREGYPADDGKIGKLLRALADAKPYEEKTSNAANYPALGVEDTSDAKASGVRIELAGSAKPVNLIVGKQGVGAQSTYVRRAGEPTSWLVRSTIDSSSAPNDWLRKEIVDISADRMQSAVVTTGTAKPYTAAKATRADSDFKVTGLPKGKELSSNVAANSAASALVGLTLADVRTRKEFESTPPAAHAVFTTFDGLVAQVDGWKKDEKHFVAVNVAYDPAVAERYHVATTTSDPKADKAATPATESKPEEKKVEDEAKADAARLTGWVYEVPQYKYDAIFKPVDDLIKK